jgi:hypothetical protein
MGHALSYCLIMHPNCIDVVLSEPVEIRKKAFGFQICSRFGFNKKLKCKYFNFYFVRFLLFFATSLTNSLILGTLLPKQKQHQADQEH